MKERPILFNREMVRAIIEGRKTQTRRPLKVQPKPDPSQIKYCGEKYGHMCESKSGKVGIFEPNSFKCPFGQVGDRLWVRETFDAFEVGHVHYCADYSEDSKGEKEHGVVWTPSIHMPRWASRITLEITDIRVEKLQNISEEDSFAEGAEGKHFLKMNQLPMSLTRGIFLKKSFRYGFYDIWTSVFGNDSWEKNPWVWVITFKAIKIAKRGN